MCFAPFARTCSIYGLVWRVGIGALLSSVDASTDIYVVGTYYSEGLNRQANAMLAMISANLIIQLLIVFAQNQNKRWKVKLKEALITLLFMRPIVDAYRISTSHDDDETAVDPLVELIINKVRPYRIFSG